MRKGRTVVILAAAFIAGDFIGEFIPYRPLLWLILTIIAAAVPLRRPSPAALLCPFVLCGAAALQISRLADSDAVSCIELWAQRCKDSFSSCLEMIMDEGDELSVLKALTIGDKSGLDFQLKCFYRSSGAAHLLALSGLHVGIIYKILGYSLFFIGGSRLCKYIRTVAILAALWAFAVVTGLSPSIFRAVLMITIHEISSMMNTSRDAPVSLAVSAMIITLANPEAPRDIGFQLSFMACIGIFVIHPRLKMMLRTRSRLLNYIWNAASLAISCQVFTGPLSYYYFGTFPKYFLLTNILTVPLSGAAIYLAAASMLTVRLPAVGAGVSELLKMTISLLNRTVETISLLN